MLKNYLFSLKTCVFMTIMFVIGAHASTPFSQYGMIQNVQNYSGNPFYNPNSPTINTPKMVYATGPALKPGDCERTVQTLVANVCAQKNNCQNTTLADVRPTLMIQLSNMPGYNYASSCAGYIDTIYEDYVKQRQNINSVNPSGFPTAPTTTTNQNIPKWQADYNERAAELKALQAQTNSTDYAVTDTDFPKTADDLSLQDSIALKKASYAPYADAKVYVPLEIERNEKESGYGGQGGSKPTECQQIYTCIYNFGKQEEQARDQFDAEKGNSANSGTFIAAKTNLTNAVRNAILSACTCTEKSVSKSAYRKQMNVSCDKKFIQNAQTTAENYVTGL